MAYKIKTPLFFQAGRYGFRKYYGIPKKLHKEGELVEYKDKPAIIEKVTKKGIYVQQFTKPNGLSELSKRKIFISEGKIEEGKVYPLMPVIAV
jgi:hypothetical protein